MNLVILVGRLTADPEIRTTNSGRSVASFRIAVDRPVKQEGLQNADFFNVTAWGRQAEVIHQYLRKGRQIALRGNLRNRSYQAKDGSKRYVTEIVLDSFDFIGGKNDSGMTTRRSSASMNEIPLDIDDDFSMIDEDEDVPF